MMENQDFKFEWEEQSLTVERIVLTGSLDRSIDPEESPLVKKLQTEVREKSAGKIIVFDLNDFGTWDTEGIRAIIGALIEPLVNKEKDAAKIGICGPKKFDGQPSQLFEDAQIKFQIVDSSKLPWEENIEAVLKRLSS